MRFSLTILLLASWPACGQLRDVVKSDEVDKMFARAGPSVEALAKPNFAVVFRVISGKPGAWQKHPDADEFWFVRHGAASVSLDTGDAGSAAGRQLSRVAAGDVVNVPRSTAYQITPSAGGFEYVAVRVFPVERRLGIGIGATGTPHRMPAVGRKAQIDATLATADKNVLLHSAGVYISQYTAYRLRGS